LDRAELALSIAWSYSAPISLCLSIRANLHRWFLDRYQLGNNWGCGKLQHRVKYPILLLCLVCQPEQSGSLPRYMLSLGSCFSPSFRRWRFCVLLSAYFTQSNTSDCVIGYLRSGICCYLFCCSSAYARKPHCHFFCNRMAADG